MVVLLEPAWVSLQNLWAAHHWAHARQLLAHARRHENIVADAILVPASVSIVAALLQCGPLHSRYQPVDHVLGLSIDSTMLVQREPSVVSVPLWMHDCCVLLSQPQEVKRVALDSATASLQVATSCR